MKTFRSLAWSLLLIGLPLLSCTPPTEVLTGTVTRISDGDTFHMLLADKTTRKVRLYGIDCPEKDQPFYRQARNTLSDLIFQEQVKVITKSRDQFGRILGIAYIHDSCVNELLLRLGMAWHFKRYDQNPEWDKLQQAARKGRTGLWSDLNPTPPWAFRKNK